MKKILVGFFVFMAVCMAAFGPVAVAQAQFSVLPSLQIPDCGTDCTFSHFVMLIQNITTFLLLLSFPVAVILFSYAGFRLLTSQGNPSRLEEAKQILLDVAIGLFIALTAWLVVRLITSALLNKEGYVDFLKSSSVISDTMQS